MTDISQTSIPVVSAAPPRLAYATDDRPLGLGELAELAVKVLGIYCFILAVPLLELPLLPFLNVRGFDLRMSMIRASVYAIYAAAGVILIWRARRFARKLVPSSTTLIEGPRPRTRELQGVLISILGLYFMGCALFNFAEGIAISYAANSNAVGWLRAIPGILEFLIGLVLFLRAKGIAVVWHRLRSAGNPSEQAEGGS